jgi:hypothetical protein
MTKSYWNASETYQKYLDYIKDNPDLNLKESSANEYVNAEGLESGRTVWIGSEYKKWTKNFE